MRDMKLSTLLLLGSLILITLGCNQGNIDLDNAGENKLEVVIDELTIEMEAGQFQRMKLDKGRHTLTIKDAEGKVLEETTFRVVEGGLLNIAKSNYLIWTDLYGDPVLRESKLNEDWIEIGDQSFKGEFEKLDPGEIYVEKKWDYGLGEEFPDDLLGWEMGKEKYIIKRKLFREKDMVEAYNALVKEN